MFKRKYIKSIVLLLTLLSLFFYYHGFYFAVNIKGPSIEKKIYLLNNKPFNDSIKLKLYVFNTGMNKVSSLLVGNINPWRPVPAFVIEHPKYGLIVFDSGLPSKIAQIGNKYLHPITRMLFDTRSLKGKDLNNMTRMNGFEPDFIAKLQKKRPFKKIDFSSGKPFATFKKSIDLLGDGSIIAVQGNGHLNGSISLFVRLPMGMVFLAGDEAISFDWLNSDDVQRISKNPKKAAEIRNRIRMLRKLRPNIIIFPGHDFPKVPKNRTDIIIYHPELFAKKAWPLN